MVTNRALAVVLGAGGALVAVVPNLEYTPLHAGEPLGAALVVVGLTIVAVAHLLYTSDDGIDRDLATAKLTITAGGALVLGGPSIAGGTTGLLAAAIGAPIALAGLLRHHRLQADNDRLVADERLERLNARAAHRSWQLVLFTVGSAAVALLYADPSLGATVVPALVAVVFVGIVSKEVLYGYYTARA